MPLVESPDGTVILSPTDPPIVDALGNVYRMGYNHVIVNAAVDEPGFQREVVSKIAYCGRHVWCLDGDGNWRSKRHPGDPWSEPTRISPLIMDRLIEIEFLVRRSEAAICTIAIQVQKIFDVVARNIPTEIRLDVAGASIASQPVPENPGP